MKRIFAGFWLGFFFLSGNAWAEVLELRGRGYVNGKVLSDDGQTIQFKNPQGKVEVISKKDILYQERDFHTIKSKRSQETKPFSIEGAVADTKEAVQNFSKGVKEKYPEMTKKIADMGKPLDVKHTDSQKRADAFAKAIEEANEATAAMDKKTREMNRAMREVDT